MNSENKKHADKDHGVWERPKPVARDRNFRAWLVFIGIFFIIAALWNPLRSIYYKRGVQRVGRTGIRDSESFLAIAYSGVDVKSSALPSDTTVENFESHLQALRDNGYVPIGIDDVVAFYRDDQPLPRKAILTTFEQSRRTSYFETRSIMRKLGWRAVMGVTTKSIRRRDAQSLLWPYLRDMVMLHSWDLAAESEDGFDFIETPSGSDSRPFFAGPRWIADAGRFETPDEFSARAAGDHEKTISEFKKETGSAPKAFFFPYGEYGQHDSRAHVVRMINLNMVDKYYGVGFSVGSLAYNDRSSDSRRLNRLLVNPEWSAETLIRKLDSFWPDGAEHTESRDRYADAWIGEWGDVFSREDDLVLRAIPSLEPMEHKDWTPPDATTGAKAWLSGSDSFCNGEMVLRFYHKRGTFGIYLRATHSGSHLYLSCNKDGKITLRQKLQDMDEVVLATSIIRSGLEGGHELAVWLRDNLFYARLDGELLFDGAVRLPGKAEPGLIGAGVWDPLPGIAEVSIIGVRLGPQRKGVVTWSPELTLNDPYLVSWLNEHGYSYTVFAPPWLDINVRAAVTVPPWDKDTLDLLARKNGGVIFPQLHVHDFEALTQITVEDLLQRLQEHDVPGIYIDSSSCDSQQISLLVPWIKRLNKVLQEENISILLRLPHSIETSATAQSITRLFENVTFVGDPKGEAVKRNRNLFISQIQVPEQTKESDLSLYYQITELKQYEQNVSQEVQGDALRQKGFEAFWVGEYNEALKHWQAWSELEPDNARALALMGDCFVRMLENEKALAAYTESLDRDPGQVELVIRRSALLEKMGRSGEAAEHLDVYARAFPGHPPLIIAQSQWLERNKQHDQAVMLASNLVTRFPDNVEARLLLQRMLSDPQMRYANIKQLLNIGTANESARYAFGQNIFNSGILTIPEASVFFDFMRNMASHGESARCRSLYRDFLPLTNRVNESFTDHGFSGRWLMSGGLAPTKSGRYELRAGSSLSEAYLRLKQSELLRDAFLEVTLDETVGAFWLYARRSDRSLVRFGYDDAGYLRSQAWQGDMILNSDSQPWMRPPGTVTMRLEMRADGLHGYVNGVRKFNMPLFIPNEVSYGWWGVAPFTPELGRARARITNIKAGPLSPAIAFLPFEAATDIVTSIDRLRLQARNITAISPQLFSQSADGDVPGVPLRDLTPYRLFASLHRLRFLPLADLAYFATVDPEVLVELITKHRLDGLVLKTRAEPAGKWFSDMAEALERTRAIIIVVEQEDPFWQDAKAKPDQPVTDGDYLAGLVTSRVREIQRGSLIFHPIESAWEVPLQNYDDWRQDLSGSKLEKIEPTLLVVPPYSE